MKYKIRKYIHLFIFALSLGCSKPEPVIPVSGFEQCHNCSMSIVDLRFHAQAISTKGKRYYFDSIECLDLYKKNAKESFELEWVANYMNPKDMIPYEKAIIHSSSAIRSPMGGGFAAFKTESDFVKTIELLNKK